MKLKSYAKTMRIQRLFIVDMFMPLSNIEREYLSFDLQRVWQEQIDIDMLMSQARLYFSQMGFSVHGMDGGTILDTCYADKRNQATINFDGEILKCTARDFKKETGEGLLQEDGLLFGTINTKQDLTANSRTNHV